MIQLSRNQIERLVSIDRETAEAVRDAYAALSDGRATVPPVGHLPFPQADGDCHIKYGFIAGDDVFVVKIASGFYRNPERDLPSSQGVVLVFSARTGQLQALLNDEGYLTDLRTGLGGAVATLALCRPDARRFLIVGTGTQAYWLGRAVAHLAGRPIELGVWGRAPARAERLVSRLGEAGAAARRVPDLEEAVRAAEVVITATPASEPLVGGDWIAPGCHVTAVGADAPGKQELDAALVARADLRVADSLAQSLDHGEFANGRSRGLFDAAGCVELGAVLNGTARGRMHRDDVTVADLTGVATQDIAMARTVLARSQA